MFYKIVHMLLEFLDFCRIDACDVLMRIRFAYVFLTLFMLEDKFLYFRIVSYISIAFLKF